MVVLPPKEHALHKRLLKCYDHKQYKMGLKFAKQILSNPKCSEHGETLAMKGLILGILGKKEEGYECVRRGLKNDLKSSVCWHAYGLLQRLDNKYDEAIKCYRNSLKLDKDNLQILRDVCFLQIQTRDIDGYRESAYQIFQLRPAQRISWVGFTVACHLSKMYDLSLEVLRTMNKSDLKDTELSELNLYENMLLREAGETDQALDHLLKNQSKILDKISLETLLADTYMRLGKNRAAIQHLENLLDKNPENIEYYEKLFVAHGLDTNCDKVRFLEAIISAHPNYSLPKRLLLNYLEGPRFAEAVEIYLQQGLRKGVPALFINLRGLYDDPSKKQVIESLLLKYVENLINDSSFLPNGKEEPKTALLWVYLYLAQHYDYFGDTANALMCVDLGLEHTPTLVELYLTKGKIYKHAGDMIQACRWVDEAQSLDTADRYINCKCAKYMLQADLIEEAAQVCAPFTTEGTNVFAYLNDIQCMWFLIECARSYQRMGKLDQALKKCHEISAHFDQMEDDQFDFHVYCQRKLSLRAYVEFLRHEDRVRCQKFYRAAAYIAINIYLKIYDRPKATLEDVEQETEAMTPSEIKKLRNKKRKAKLKADLVQAHEAAIVEKREQHFKPKQTADPDSIKTKGLDAAELVQVTEPLKSATQFLKRLEEFASGSLETHLLAFEIHSRSNKPLLMLQSVRRALNLGRDDPKVHLALITYYSKVLRWKSDKSISPTVMKVIDNVLLPIVNGKTPIELNKEFLDQHTNSLPHLLHGALAMFYLDPSKKQQALALATRLDDTISSRTFQVCSTVLEALENGAFGPCESEVEEYKAKCRGLFPFATHFKAPTEQESRLKDFKAHLFREKATAKESNLDIP